MSPLGDPFVQGLQTHKISNKIWKIAPKVAYFALSFEKTEN
jgi:hypothetical protein